MMVSSLCSSDTSSSLHSSGIPDILARYLQLGQEIEEQRALLKVKTTAIKALEKPVHKMLLTRPEHKVHFGESQGFGRSGAMRVVSSEKKEALTQTRTYVSVETFYKQRFAGQQTDATIEEFAKETTQAIWDNRKTIAVTKIVRSVDRKSYKRKNLEATLTAQDIALAEIENAL
jgi:hypothetical protein